MPYDMTLQVDDRGVLSEHSAYMYKHNIWLHAVWYTQWSFIANMCIVVMAHDVVISVHLFWVGCLYVIGCTHCHTGVYTYLTTLTDVLHHDWYTINTWWHDMRHNLDNSSNDAIQHTSAYAWCVVSTRVFQDVVDLSHCSCCAIVLNWNCHEGVLL
jgi:hypothetical protein